MEWEGKGLGKKEEGGSDRGGRMRMSHTYKLNIDWLWSETMK